MIFRDLLSLAISSAAIGFLFVQAGIAWKSGDCGWMIMFGVSGSVSQFALLSCFYNEGGDNMFDEHEVLNDEDTDQ